MSQVNVDLPGKDTWVKLPFIVCNFNLVHVPDVFYLWKLPGKSPGKLISIISHVSHVYLPGTCTWTYLPVKGTKCYLCRVTWAKVPGEQPKTYLRKVTWECNHQVTMSGNLYIVFHVNSPGKFLSWQFDTIFTKIQPDRLIHQVNSPGIITR